MTDTLRRELERWGFADSEIEVYLAILQMGDGTASAVADRAGVSARHVHRIAGRLEERGLVDVDEHVQPKVLSARPPTVVQEVLDRSSSRMTDEIQSLYTRSPAENTEIEVLKRQPTVLARAGSLVENAKRWVILTGPPDVVETVEDELAAAVDRGVLVLLVTSVESLSLDRSIDAIATVAQTRPSPRGFQEFGLGVDKLKSLMVSSSAQIGDEHRYSPALYLDDATIGVRTNDSLFGIEWRLGEESVVPDPVELPFDSTFFREVVLHAALRRRAGTDLRARVECRALPDGDRTRVDGAVSEVRQGMVEPYRQTFIGERTLVLETASGRVTVGGSDAAVEDFAADEVTLYAAGDDPSA